MPDENLDNQRIEEMPEKSQKSSLNTKVFLIGLPVFVVQLVIVYFITANVLIKKLESQDPALNKTAQNDSTVQKPQTELGKYIYTIKDIIVNPADSDGNRLLLTSVGFDVGSTKMKTELKTREAMVKDIVISTLSNNGVKKLMNNAYKDTLKNEISIKLKSLVPGLKLNKVYFSKYIIQ